MFNNLLSLLNINLNQALASAITVIVPMIVSVILGIVIYFVYSKSFRGVVFNHSFSVSLALMSVLTTVITLAISSNLALSLGMVGALSIVRYRSAIKDPMDLLFLFWAVTTGITTGAHMYHLALLGSFLVVVCLIFINRYEPSSKMYVMILNYAGDDIDDELRRILRDKRYQIKSKTIRQQDVELAAEIRISRDNFAFLNQIRALPSVNNVTLVQYNGDYNG